MSPRAVDALLRRRNLWLLVFGLVHTTLLFVGDILGAYGLAGLVLGRLFLRRADRTLRILIAALLGFMALLALFSLVGLALAPADGIAGQGDTAQMYTMTAVSPRGHT